MTLKVAFRLDASPDIGLGHLMRCLAIAARVRLAGAECHFLCYQLPAALHPLLPPHHLHALSALDDAGPLPDLQPDWLVVDHYKVDRVIEERLAIHCTRVLVIDDLADRPHHCHLLLDQGPLRTPDDYQHHVPAHCRLLLGSQFALLRPSFRALARQAAPAWRRGLICFGGADPAGACLITLNALAALPWARQFNWTLIAGSANPCWPELAQRVAALPDLAITLLRQGDEMAPLMAQHDFAIGAAGGMTWERACLGLPTLAIPIVDNQQFNDEVIAHFQLAERLTLAQLASPEQLQQALCRLQLQADHYRQRGQALVDGLGLDRLTAWLLPHSTYRLIPNGQQWQFEVAAEPLMTLTLNQQHLAWHAQRPLSAQEWQQLAYSLLAVFSHYPLYLAAPPPMAPIAPWRLASTGWQLDVGA